MNSFLSDITKEEINNLKVSQFNGPVRVISNEKDIPAMVNILRKYPVIGFDTESKPSFRKGTVNGIALLQLATPDEAFLVRVRKTRLPDVLIRFFEDEEIIKTGVAIKDDIKKLKAIRDFKAASFLELQDYSSFFMIQGNSLKKLAAIVLGVKISKSQQLSDWESPHFTEPQIRYAATDAWVCQEIYNTLRKTISE